MSFKSINVEMTPEIFDRSIKGSPKDAIKELIWNACDADAKNIEVSFVYGGIAGAETVSEVIVKDDGHGIQFENVTEYFGKYGRSQKTYSEKSPGGRTYHGKLGQGRYKSLSIGSFVEWNTTYCSEGKYYTYEVHIDSGSRMNLSFSAEPVLASEPVCGTTVHVHGIQDDQINAVSRLSLAEEMIPDLLATFAPYLLAYKEISIKYDGTIIRPDTQIDKQAQKDLLYEDEGKEQINATAIAIRWKRSFFSRLYICGSSGVVYSEADYTLLQQNSTSLYLLGAYFEKMHRENTLAMGLADPVYVFFYEEAKKFAKEFLRGQDEDAAVAEVRKIKDEGLYPFDDGNPQDEIAKAEQNMFDVLAVEVNRAVPQLKASHKQTKKLTYRLMREAINTNPSSIKTILTEVFNLTQEQQNDLAELLTHTHLPEIIDTAKTVGDRLTFIYLLEQMVYNDSIGKSIKERTQFHRLLLKELWVFGEKYALGTSDQSLKNLLFEHIKCLGRDVSSQVKCTLLRQQMHTFSRPVFSL